MNALATENKAVNKIKDCMIKFAILLINSQQRAKGAECV